MALFGVIGGPLLAASGVAVLLGIIPQGSPIQSLATLPEIDRPAQYSRGWALWLCSLVALASLALAAYLAYVPA